MWFSEGMLPEPSHAAIGGFSEVEGSRRKGVGTESLQGQSPRAEASDQTWLLALESRVQRKPVKGRQGVGTRAL